MMTSFSTNATVSFDGLSEPMDEETTAIFEQVVTGQLIDASIENKDQEHQVFISSVKVIDQQVIKVGNYRRSLATTVLQIIIKVTGEVEPEAPASYVTNVTVSIQDELEEEESHQELTKRLAKESTFFDSYYSQQNELVVAEAQRGTTTDDSSQPPWIVLIVGGCVAVAILVGSMFYMERRSANGAGRRVARQDGFQHYDLSAAAGMMDEEMQGHVMAPLVSPKIVQESRMKSAMDFDDEKVRGVLKYFFNLFHCISHQYLFAFSPPRYPILLS